MCVVALQRNKDLGMKLQRLVCVYIALSTVNLLANLPLKLVQSPAWNINHPVSKTLTVNAFNAALFIYIFLFIYLFWNYEPQVSSLI